MCALSKRKVMLKVLCLASLLSIELLATEPRGSGTREVPIPRAFEGQPQTPGAGAGPAEEKWWRTLSDPELDRLLERAVQNNLDLQLATQRLHEARAARRISRADLAPSVG